MRQWTQQGVFKTKGTKRKAVLKNMSMWTQGTASCFLGFCGIFMRSNHRAVFLNAGYMSEPPGDLKRADTLSELARVAIATEF